jgi:hypothetical protein
VQLASNAAVFASSFCSDVEAVKTIRVVSTSLTDTHKCQYKRERVLVTKKKELVVLRTAVSGCCKTENIEGKFKEIFASSCGFRNGVTGHDW